MSYYDKYVDFSSLVGKTLTEVNVGDDEILFKTADESFRMFHNQDCCESVGVDDVCGDVEDLIGTPILQADEASDDENIDPFVIDEDREKNEFWEALSSDLDDDDNSYGDYSQTWTFYKLATIKGSVTIRWYGSSNGYYSESVDFMKE